MKVRLGRYRKKCRQKYHQARIPKKLKQNENSNPNPRRGVRPTPRARQGIALVVPHSHSTPVLHREEESV